jgi:hypothetical protein
VPARRLERERRQVRPCCRADGVVFAVLLSSAHFALVRTSLREGGVHLGQPVEGSTVDKLLVGDIHGVGRRQVVELDSASRSRLTALVAGALARGSTWARTLPCTAVRASERSAARRGALGAAMMTMMMMQVSLTRRAQARDRLSRLTLPDL